MIVKILPSAKQDLRDGFTFYERQADGLGTYFLDTLLADIDSLSLFAGIHTRRGQHHRFISKRFPYWIYYRIEHDIVFVSAILDARQNPLRISRREMDEPE